MYEVEMKVRARHDPVRDRLRGVDATREWIGFQADTYYDAPDRSFAETDEALRVRRETTLPADAPLAVDSLVDAYDEDDEPFASLDVNACITYKGPKVDESSKTRREIETGVATGDSAGAIFEALGFDAAATVVKRRERWTVDGVTVTLDDVDGLGEFVEVEIEADGETDVSKDTGLDAPRERVASTLRTLDLDPDTQIRTSYLGLLVQQTED